MAEFKQEIGEGLSVQLTVNLKKYCELAKNFLEIKTGGADTLDTEAVSKAKRDFLAERKNIIEQLSGLAGDAHWKNIQKNLASKLKEDNPTEKALKAYFDNPYVATETPPLGVECLEAGFIELLKNSMDAVVKSYLDGVSPNTNVEVNILLDITEDTIKVHIIDNAGGFPADYLANLDDYLAGKKYLTEKLNPESKSSSETKYLFGGAGIGLPIIYNKLLDGSDLSSGGSIEKYKVPPGDTSISITNTGNGAEIVLNSPVRPFELVELSSYGLVCSAIGGRASPARDVETPGGRTPNPASNFEETVTPKPSLFIRGGNQAGADQSTSSLDDWDDFDNLGEQDSPPKPGK